ncbi:NADPH-dependent 1-acyl dihydroxyacetone phosphate reductase [Coemansia sp. RSA 2522]|nr:NADPH-dependent 1-acyl dihydroxyacetone phosphate reductase [Coemansia sp. RSA 2522]
MSDAMRMELAPFNIRVVVVAPGGIQSNLAEHQQVELPENSPFMPAIQAIRDRAVFSQAGNATPTDVFARVVASRILASNPPPYITYGNHARTTWLLHYAPAVLRDWIYSRRFGTAQLRQKSCPFTGKSSHSSCPARAHASGISCPFSSPFMWCTLGVAFVAAHFYTHPELVQRFRAFFF